jgi:hypothetical protein
MIVEIILFICGLLLGGVAVFLWLMFYLAKGFNW